MLAISEDIGDYFLPGEFFVYRLARTIELYLPLWDTFIAYELGTLLYRQPNIITNSMK